MSSRKEQKEALRRERLEREQQAAASERRKRLVGFGAAGILAGAALVALVVVLLSGGGGDGGGDAPAERASAEEFPAASGPIPAARITDLEEAADAAGCEVEQNESEGNEHVDGPVSYRTNPPSSGNHFVVPADDGAYTSAPPTEHLVHSLEHGRILIQYRPDVPDDVKGDLKALFDEDPYHVLLAPNETDMPYEVAATTWTRTLGCPEMNDEVFDAVRAFRDEYRDKGPEFVP